MIRVSKWFVPRGYRGITLFPFIFLAKADLFQDATLIRHEKIHLRQQAELLIIPFYAWYGVEFLVRYIQYKNKGVAYRNISFEREAFAQEYSCDYLKNRSFFAWIKYL
ncbi:hypothetical protein ACFQ3R_13830 [Mesonia ostreae]